MERLAAICSGLASKLYEQAAVKSVYDWLGAV